MKLGQITLSIGLFCGLISCTDASPDVDSGLSQLIELWQGEYAPAPDTAGPIQPYVMIRQVDLPSFGEAVVYMEIRNQTRTGPAIRQRIFAFDDNTDRAQNQIQSYDFLGDGWAPYVGAYDEPSKLAALTPDQMYRFPEGCEIVWRREVNDFVGEVTKDRCHISSRRNGALVHADMIFTVSEKSFDQFEVIYDDAGGTIVGNPEAPPIVSHRVTKTR